MSIFTEAQMNIAKTAPWLVIKAAKNAAAKYANFTFYNINGVIHFVDPSTDVEDVELTDINVLTGYDRIITVTVDVAKATHAYATAPRLVSADVDQYSNEATDLVPKNEALIGFIYIYAVWADFTGWTSELDDANFYIKYIDAYSSVWM